MCVSSTQHEGHASVVKSLLQNCAKVNVEDNNGWTPLLTAAQNGIYWIWIIQE